MRLHETPICVLPAVIKLIKRSVFNQLYQYLNSNNLPTDYQSGFRQLFQKQLMNGCGILTITLLMGWYLLT